MERSNKRSFCVHSVAKTYVKITNYFMNIALPRTVSLIPKFNTSHAKRGWLAKKHWVANCAHERSVRDRATNAAVEFAICMFPVSPSSL